MLENRRGIVFWGTLFVCGLLCSPAAWGAEEPEEQTKPVKTETKAPITEKSAVEKHEAILQQPVRVEIKKGDTLGGAIQKMGVVAGLKIEFEGFPPVVWELFYEREVNHDAAVNARTFQHGLEFLGKEFSRAVDNLEIETILSLKLGAIPTPTGTLISNAAIRHSGLCKLISRPYPIHDLGSDYDTISELSNLIRNHVKGLWRQNAQDNKFKDAFKNEYSLNSLEANLFLSSIDILHSKKILVIRTSRSAHYEIKQFLTQLRKVIKEQQKQADETGNLF